MPEVKDKLITAENLKNAYDDNKRAISELKETYNASLKAKGVSDNLKDYAYLFYAKKELL